MVAQLIRTIFHRHQYWRTISFAELAEFYIARFLRIVSQGMVGVMVAVLLYQNGYSLFYILVLFSFYYCIRIASSFFFGYMVAWMGPKQSTLVSNILAIPALISLTLLNEFMDIAAISFFIFEALSISLYTITSAVHFSSIKHSRHAGREIGWMHSVEKIAAGIAPLVGGLVAYWLGPESTIWAAALISMLAAMPLFLTPEKTQRHQRITYQGLSLRSLRTQLVSSIVAGADLPASGFMWSLFAALMIFGTADDSVYAKLGFFFSLSLFAAIIVSHIYGRVIDHRRGGDLYKAGIIANSLIHAVRPLVSTPLGVAFTNVSNEVTTSAYFMPYIRGMYDVADNLPGYRVAYISMMAVFFCIGALLLSLLAAGLVWHFGERLGLSLGFGAMALIGLFGVRHGFTSLRR